MAANTNAKGPGPLRGNVRLLALLFLLGLAVRAAFLITVLLAENGTAKMGGDSNRYLDAGTMILEELTYTDRGILGCY